MQSSTGVASLLSAAGLANASGQGVSTVTAVTSAPTSPTKTPTGQPGSTKTTSAPVKPGVGAGKGENNGPKTGRDASKKQVKAFQLYNKVIGKEGQCHGSFFFYKTRNWLATKEHEARTHEKRTIILKSSLDPCTIDLQVVGGLIIKQERVTATMCHLLDTHDAPGMESVSENLYQDDCHPDDDA